MKTGAISLENLDAIIFDFDGVLTDNRVLVDQNGTEYVSCHRGDGLAFDSFRKLKINVFIFSTESNSVVSARANKLKIPVIQNVSNKLETLKLLAIDKNIDLSKTLYIGNDLNDYHAMKKCGMSACPADSHPEIIKIAGHQLKVNGGDAVAREIVENILKIDIVDLLYST